jgi:ADP-ribose pyrophosphatase
MKVLKSEVLYQGRLRGIRDYLETNEGKRYTHETIVHPGAVVILPVHADGSIMCVSQYRHSVGIEMVELPAGTLEENEPPQECAHREIMEEIGMAAHEMIPVGTLYPAPGFCSELQHLFVARGLYPKSATPDEDENISVVPMTVEQFEHAVVSGAVCDAKSIALFARARLMGLV